MSRIGNKQIEVPASVTLTVSGQDVAVKGPQGELNWTIPEGISMAQEGATLSFSRSSDQKEQRSLHGLSRALIANMIEGVANGYKKELVLEGVGFRAQSKGRGISMAVGLSSPVEYEPPEGVTLTLPNDTTIEVTGADKQKVGLAAARIRGFRPAEPYKGKGVRYKNEQIRRKAGKTVA